MDGDLDPLKYVGDVNSFPETDKILEGDDLEEVDNPKTRGRRPAISHFARLAILAEFKRRLEAGEIEPGAKRQGVILLAVEWAWTHLGLRVKETATREVLLPVLERIPAK